jgi:hypothetical protein
VLLVGAVTLVLAHTAAARPASGLYGHATLAPTCPVERNPPDPNCAPRDLARTLIVVRRHGTPLVVLRARTDASGYFRLPLAQGRYDLYVDAGIRRLTNAALLNVRVARHHYTHLELHVDSGIR